MTAPQSTSPDQPGERVIDVPELSLVVLIGASGSGKSTFARTHFATLPAAAKRHPDHRFEWTRAEFRSWAASVATTHGYQVSFRPVGPEHPQDGPPTQLAVFTKQAPWN